MKNNIREKPEQENQETGKIGQTNLKQSLEEFAKLLFKLRVGEKYDFIFDEDRSVTWGVTRIDLFDAKLIIFSYYGGGDSFLHDITHDTDHKELLDVIKRKLADYTKAFIFLSDIGR
ncbi:hypothetical protein CLV62_15213 [Dysgonomonas alginatilytica]|uniref:Uncharacterized protein n=1 Tax=Dysgonomonas alginatilytica TaxID=1605892 RepID=A0A2V3PJ95_9BACT|nr:hypothetical protein [Dysgonomonas alginatilytica]PXV57429.1 hypothetical protein CLV62_15213 [Dysgonomonas alginatilytica]